MPCEKCGADTRVTDSRNHGGKVYRRRKCEACGHGFTTYEWAMSPKVMRKAAFLMAKAKATADDPWRDEKQADWRKSGRTRATVKPGEAPMQLALAPSPPKQAPKPPEPKPGGAPLTLRERLAARNAANDPMRAVAREIGYDYGRIKR